MTKPRNGINNAKLNNKMSMCVIKRINYLRFRKLTFEVKLLLKLEKFSVPLFSCENGFRNFDGWYIGGVCVYESNMSNRVNWTFFSVGKLTCCCGAQIRPQPALAIVLILTYVTQKIENSSPTVAVFDWIYFVLLWGCC